MMENKKTPNAVLPKKIVQGDDIVTQTRKLMKGGEEMANKTLFNTVVKACEKEFGKRKQVPWGVDNKVYEGVRVGLQAVKAKNAPKAKSKTVCLGVDRWDKRLFTLPQALSENQAKTANVSLNGNPCVEGRDYTISDNVLNWMSDRRLYKTDSIAVCWQPEMVVTHYRKSLGATSHIDDLAQAVLNLDAKVAEGNKKMSERVAELSICVEVLDDDYEEVSSQVGALGESVSVLECSAQEDEEEEDLVLEPVEEEEMIEAGVKVYHRLNDGGPWIVIQPTVLNINSRQVDSDSEVFKHGFVENAWTVQTEDGTKDYPEVVLTTRKPKATGMSWPKKIALGVAAVVTAAAVVHAPLLLQLIGMAT